MNKAGTSAIVTMALVTGVGFWAGVSAAPTAGAAKARVATSETVIYVSPSGNDKWSGGLASANARQTDGPLATIQGARDRIRVLRGRGPLTKPVRVAIAGGTYRIGAPIDFEPEDSGTRACPITYEGSTTSPSTISGGRVVTGWKQAGSVWSTHLPAVASGDWAFSSLWVDGERRGRARTPNSGFLYTAGKLGGDDASRGFRFREGDLAQWPDLDQAVVVAYHAWESSTHRVDSLDPGTSTVTLSTPSPWPFENGGPGQRYQVENVAAALDAPGEWTLNQHTGVLSYIPMPGEDMAKAQVVAPVTANLLIFNGDPTMGSAVTHISVRNLQFMHTEFSEATSGHADAQAEITVPAAIEATGARDCSIRRCELSHLGTHGIWLRAGCQGVSVEHNEIHDMAGGGVYVGAVSAANVPSEICSGNVVDNNFIHDGTKIFHGAVGVWIGKSSYNKVTHNEICDLDYTGVSVGWTWGYAPSDANHNAIEYNHIHDLGRGVMSDMGAIYTLGISPGTTERYNLIHDVYCYEGGYGGWGVYTDEGSSGILIENNIVYGTTSAGFHQHYGERNVLLNNIFALGRDGQLQRTRSEAHLSFTLAHNIIVANGQPILAANWADNQYTLDSNLYWDYAGEPTFAGMSRKAWAARGQDVHSAVADPMFADPMHGDFTLAANSPALALGFVPIDMSKTGLFGEAEWVARPKAIARTTYKPTLPQAQTPIADGFEDELVGTTPRRATAIEDGATGTVRVTDETAAVGTHSLKVFEAPGCKNSWDPHVYYTTAFKTGTLAESFWLRGEQGTSMYSEWRDAASPYHVGPRFSVAADGTMRAGNRKVTKLTAGQWYKVEITCGLGTAADGTFSIAVTPQGGDAAKVDNLKCGSKDFKELNWLGWVSDGVTNGTFYLDDISVGPAQPTPVQPPPAAPLAP